MSHTFETCIFFTVSIAPLSATSFSYHYASLLINVEEFRSHPYWTTNQLQEGPSKTETDIRWIYSHIHIHTYHPNYSHQSICIYAYIFYSTTVTTGGGIFQYQFEITRKSCFRFIDMLELEANLKKMKDLSFVRMVGHLVFQSIIDMQRS